MTTNSGRELPDAPGCWFRDGIEYFVLRGESTGNISGAYWLAEVDRGTKLMWHGIRTDTFPRGGWLPAAPPSGIEAALRAKIAEWRETANARTGAYPKGEVRSCLRSVATQLEQLLTPQAVAQHADQPAQPEADYKTPEGQKEVHLSAGDDCDCPFCQQSRAIAQLRSEMEGARKERDQQWALREAYISKLVVAEQRLAAELKAHAELVGHTKEWKRRAESAEAERDRLRQRLLTAAGDDLCRLTQEEIKELSSGAVKIPPKAEFLASCERFHQQIAGEAGVLTNCLTLSQLAAENEKLKIAYEAAEARLSAMTTKESQ